MHFLKSDQSWNTRQGFLKIQSLCEAALETGRRCFSNIILESNVTSNITRSSDSFSTVPPIVNGGDWGCIVRDLETIIEVVLLAFNFIPVRSHHSNKFPHFVQINLFPHSAFHRLSNKYFYITMLVTGV